MALVVDVPRRIDIIFAVSPPAFSSRTQLLLVVDEYSSRIINIVNITRWNFDCRYWGFCGVREVRGNVWCVGSL